MSQTRRQFAASALALTLAPAALAQARQTPIVIARGAAGGWPAQTRLAYEQAINQGADFLEAPLVCSKDGVLMVRADDELSATTDVAQRSDYADRRATRVIDGAAREGWFTEDFTAPELTGLALAGSPRERRGASGAPAAILTFEEIIAIARAGSVRQMRVIGVYASLTHPAYFANLGLALEPKLAQMIRAEGYDSPAAAMIVASGDPRSLTTLDGLTRARRVQRVGPGSAAQMLSPEGLKDLAGRVFAVAPDAGLALDLTNPRAPKSSGLIEGAHAAGLRVHAWAGSESEAFPAAPLKSNDTRRLLADLFQAGADGVCADNAALAVRARADAQSARRD